MRLTESSINFSNSTIFSFSLSCLQRQCKRKKLKSELNVDTIGDEYGISA